MLAYVCTELQYLQVAYKRVRLRPHVQEIPTNLQIPAELHIDARVRQPFNGWDMSGEQQCSHRKERKFTLYIVVSKKGAHL